MWHIRQMDDRLIKVEKHFLVHIRKSPEYNPNVSVCFVYFLCYMLTKT